MKHFFVLTRNSYKKYAIWSFIWLLMGAFIAWMFEPLRQQIQTEDFLGAFNSDLLEAFNITDEYFSTVENLTGGEFLTFLTLVGGIFASVAGVGIVAGRIEDRTITMYMQSKVSRITYVFSAWLAEVILIFISTLFIMFATYLSFILLSEQEDISEEFFIYSAVGVSLVLFFFLTLGLFAGTIYEQSRAQSIVISAAVIFWFLDTFSELDQYPDVLRPLSPYSYFDIEALTSTFGLESIIVLLPLSSIVLLAVSIYSFVRKSVYV